MSSPKDFAFRIGRRARRLERNVQAKIAEAATVVLYGLAEGSPVDTGKLVSNWIVTGRSPSNNMIQAHVPGKNKSTETINRSVTMQKGRGKILSLKDGSVFHITNNVPYLAYQNTGFINAAVRDGQMVIGSSRIKALGD